MKIAILLFPHANARYFESVKKLALLEVSIMLRAIDEKIEAEEIENKGLYFITFDIPALDDRMRRLLSMFSCVYGVFEVEGNGGLIPLMRGGPQRFGGDLSGILKYRGKTNENFTGMLLNLAVFSSNFAKDFDRPLSVFDPMCGRGTTLFEAVRRDWDAYGVEIDKSDVEETVKFLKKYAQYNHLKHKVESSSLTVDGKNAGQRTRFYLAENSEILRNNPRTLSVTLGDTQFSDRFYKGRHFHALACDLPYGIQHESRDGQNKVSLDRLIGRALTVWKKTLLPGAAVAISFNSNTLPLEEARKMLAGAGFEPISGNEYDCFSHWVEQAITRDIAVARYVG